MTKTLYYCSAIERKQGGVFSEATAGRDSSFCDVSVGETAARRSRECGGGSDPPWIRHLKKTIPGGPELKKKTRLVTAVKC